MCWQVLAFMFNTIIFYIAGFKLGMLFVDFAAVDGADFEYAWAMYPVVLLTRAVTIALLFPLLSYCGKKRGMPLSWRSAVIMWWGGLRGSVGLALALSVFHTNYSHDMWGGASMAWGEHKMVCVDVPSNALTMTRDDLRLEPRTHGSTGALPDQVRRSRVVGTGAWS